MKCKECGRQIPDGALFCKYCGARANASEEDAQATKRLDFEKGQKGVRRRSGKKASAVVVALVAVLIVAIGVLAAVLIWKNSSPAEDQPADPPVSETQETTEWTASTLPQNGEVEVGGNMMLNAAVDQELGEVTVDSVTWTSSDDAIATVKDGVVNGVAEGEATITAVLTLSDGTTVESSAQVTVVKASVIYTATITPANRTLVVGNSTTLNAALEQELENGIEIVSTVWSSDNKDVAVVSNGKVTALSEGAATITVTINLSNAQAASANASITVTGDQAEGGNSGGTSTPSGGNNGSGTTTPSGGNNGGTSTPSGGNNGGTSNPPSGGNSGGTSTPSGGNSGGSNKPSGNNGGGSYSTYNAYVLPNSNTTIYSYDVLRGLSAWQLRVARNEIFARYGRMFDDPDLQAHFNMKSWYHGTIPADQFDANVLNKVELENIKRIKEVEATR